MTDPAAAAATSGGYRCTPAEIQQQLIQCTDLLRKFETSYSPRSNFFHNWYHTLIHARARYVEQEHLTEAQWHALAQEGLPE